MLAAQTERRNQAIDGLAHSVTASPKRAVVARRVARQGHAAHFEHLALRQRSFNLFRRHIVADNLKPFAENDIREPDALAIEFNVQPIRFGVPGPLEIVDPDGGIDDNHPPHS